MTFHALDYEARLTRLNALAQQALSAWGLDGASIDLLTYTNNAVYKITHGDDNYTLRIHRPDRKPLRWIKAELAWLRAINAETGLCVPQPARPVYQGELDGVASPVICVLFDWLDGEFYREQSPTAAFVHAVGRFAGELHNFSTHYTPPEDAEHTHLDWGGLFGKESAVGTPSPYDPGDGDKHFTSEQKAIIAQGAEKVRHVMDALGTGHEAYGLIHADLITKNVMMNGGSACALDFDDCSYGYYLYDLAPMLLDCKSEPNFAELRSALWEGYTAVRPQPDHYVDYLETLVAARHIASCRWIAGNADNPYLRGKVADILAHRTDRLRVFIETGVMNP